MSSVLSMVGLRELCDIQVGMSKKIFTKAWTQVWGCWAQNSSLGVDGVTEEQDGERRLGWNLRESFTFGGMGGRRKPV